MQPFPQRAERHGKPTGRSLFTGALPQPAPRLRLAAASEFMCTEVITLPGSSVTFIMVSLLEPKYKNAGRPDYMFSRKRGGEGILMLKV